MYNFDEIINRLGTDSLKWDSIKNIYKIDDLLPMWVADMDFKIVPEIEAAVNKRAKHMTYGYTIPDDTYYNSIINWNLKRNNYEIKKEWIKVSPGVIPSLKAAIYGFTEIDDKILIQTPVYPPFHNSVKAAKRQLVTNPLIFDGEKYIIDFDDFEEKIKSGVKLFIISNPHNPIGRVWTNEELEKMVDICYENNVKIISDEIHSDIIYSGYKHSVLNTISQNAKNISIICASPSKTFNIAGLCSSYVIIENEVIRKQMWEAMSCFGVDSINLFGITAGKAAYEYGETWVDEMVEYVENNAEFVCKYIKEKLPKVKTYKPQSTYLMWLDFKDYNMNQFDLMQKIVYEAHVVLNSGTDFGNEGYGFVRLNIGCPKSMIKTCIDKIASVFENN